MHLFTVLEYSHLGGAEILSVRYPEIERDIHDTIGRVDGIEPTVRSRSGGHCDRLVYDPSVLRDALRTDLRVRHFKEASYTAKLPLASGTGEFIRVRQRAALAKSGVIVDVLFGTYASPLQAMVRLQLFADKGLCQLGVAILPCHELTACMRGRGPSGEEFIHDLKALRGTVPNVPVKVILVDTPKPAPDEARRSPGREANSGGYTNGQGSRPFATVDDINRLPASFRRKHMPTDAPEGG